MICHNMLVFYNRSLIPFVVNIAIAIMLVILLIVAGIMIWSLILCHRYYSDKITDSKYSEEEIDDISALSVMGFFIVCLSLVVQLMNGWDAFLKFLGLELIIWLLIVTAKAFLTKKKH